jgi:hypothetical protein
LTICFLAIIKVNNELHTFLINLSSCSTFINSIKPLFNSAHETNISYQRQTFSDTEIRFFFYQLGRLRSRVRGVFGQAIIKSSALHRVLVYWQYTPTSTDCRHFCHLLVSQTGWQNNTICITKGKIKTKQFWELSSRPI